MLLTYRGVSYEANATRPAAVPAVDLKYRGATYRLNQVAQSASLNAVLKYRGTTYGQQPTVAAVAPVPESVPAAVASVSVEEKARILTMNHHRLVKNRQQALLSRSASELGLSNKIGNYWNHIQGKVHPSFWYSYDRSHAALS